MGRDLRGIAEWLLEPSADEAPLGVGILGWLVLFNGFRIIARGSSGEIVLGMWPSIAVGGCLVTLAVLIVTGRSIGLAGGVLAWSFHISLGFSRFSSQAPPKTMSTSYWVSWPPRRSG